MIAAYGFPIFVGIMFGYFFDRLAVIILTVMSVIVALISLALWNQEMELMLTLVIVGMLFIGNVAMWITHRLRSR
jgi:hypothetical protein